MADETVAENDPAARIRAAIAGKPAAAYAEVLADDVVTVGATVLDAQRTSTIAAIIKGSKAAPVRTNSDGERVPCPVHVEAGKLGQLLEAAGAHAQ